MKGYKAFFKNFNNQLTCRHMTFEYDSIHTMEATPNLCSSGFHFCEKLEDCFKYYPLDAIICQIEILGEFSDTDLYCSKRACNSFKIIKTLSKIEILNQIKDMSLAVKFIKKNNLTITELYHKLEIGFFIELIKFDFDLRMQFKTIGFVYEVDSEILLNFPDLALHNVRIILNKTKNDFNKVIMWSLLEDYDSIIAYLPNIPVNENVRIYEYLSQIPYFNKHPLISKYITPKSATNLFLKHKKLDVKLFMEYFDLISSDQNCLIKILEKFDNEIPYHLLLKICSKVNSAELAYLCITKIKTDETDVINKLIEFLDDSHVIKLLNNSREVSLKVKKLLKPLINSKSAYAAINCNHCFRNHINYSKIKDVAEMYELGIMYCGLFYFEDKITNDPLFVDNIDYSTWGLLTNYEKIFKFLTYIKVENRIILLNGLKKNSDLYYKVISMFNLDENGNFKKNSLVKLLNSLSDNLETSCVLENIHGLNKNISDKKTNIVVEIISKIKIRPDSLILLTSLNEILKYTKFNIFMEIDGIPFDLKNREYVIFNQAKNWVESYPSDIPYFVNKGFLPKSFLEFK